MYRSAGVPTLRSLSIPATTLRWSSGVGVHRLETLARMRIAIGARRCRASSVAAVGLCAVARPLTSQSGISGRTISRIPAVCCESNNPASATAFRLVLGILLL